MILDGIFNDGYVINYVTENSTTVIECPLKSVSSNIVWISIDTNNVTEKLTVGRTVKPGIENIKVVGNHSIGEYNLLLQRITKADEKIYGCVAHIYKYVNEFDISVRLSSKCNFIFMAKKYIFCIFALTT